MWWCPSGDLTHKALCRSSARIWSLGFSPNLLGKRKNKINSESGSEREKCEDAVETISRPTLTCQGNLCPRQLRCPARGCPSQKACFHCEETGTHCVRRTPTHQSKTNNLLWHGRSSAPDLLNYNQLETLMRDDPPPPPHVSQMD